MIIDLILDRKESATPYDPREFYYQVMNYTTTAPLESVIITAAMDYGTEKDIRRALCDYIDRQEYNPEIKKYINSVNWI